MALRLHRDDRDDGTVLAARPLQLELERDNNVPNVAFILKDSRSAVPVWLSGQD